jgi:hypothetical protein
MSPAPNGIVRWGPTVLLLLICTLLLQVLELFGIITLLFFVYSLYCVAQLFFPETYTINFRFIVILCCSLCDHATVWHLRLKYCRVRSNRQRSGPPDKHSGLTIKA